MTDKFGLGVQNEAGRRLTVLPREHTGQNFLAYYEAIRYEWK